MKSTAQTEDTFLEFCFCVSYNNIITTTLFKYPKLQFAVIGYPVMSCLRSFAAKKAPKFSSQWN